MQKYRNQSKGAGAGDQGKGEAERGQWGVCCGAGATHSRQHERTEIHGGPFDTLNLTFPTPSLCDPCER